MSLPKRYIPDQAELRLSDAWQASGVYHFEPDRPGTVYSIDTPPPTVSGYLHLGHVYSYSHVDFIARFRRMRGENVFYPMGYDDNGLPTERLVEKRLGLTARQIGRRAFIEKCLQLSESAEQEYQSLWQRLGLSIDWRFTYRSIEERSRRISQWSFIDLVHQGLAYRRQAPAIWCPECQTALAQADLNDLERQSEFVNLRFDFGPDSSTAGRSDPYLPIATTRPELLPACVAVFIHPDDPRYRGLAGKKLLVPLFGQEVPVLEDTGADPQKGTGVVMCCTFGDSTDVGWWYTHKLPLVEAIGHDGCLTQAAGDFASLPVDQARQQIKIALQAQGLILDRQATTQSLRVHERCDTPVEYVVAHQWFIRVLDYKAALLQAGEQVIWHPAHMLARYQAWVENLNWDWCISRQRYYGVPFPVWYCKECGQMMLAEGSSLPVDPSELAPSRPCQCGSQEFVPDPDVMDTWATSSLSPQIVGGWSDPEADNDLYQRVFPFSLRPQAHEIIRTWAFYSIAKSQYHFHSLPWKEVLISGWGLAGEGMGKISKSRGGGPMSPLEMITRYSADAVRYWAASTSPGKDAVISEEKIQMGSRLVTKLWNVARFCEPFLQGYRPEPEATLHPGLLTPADRWILASLQSLIRRVTTLLESYDYAAAKSEIETFFWGDLADNYLEMAKQRLYDLHNPQRDGARFALYQVLLDTLKLFAPFLPYVTEEIYNGLFSEPAAAGASIHISTWPAPRPEFEATHTVEFGELLVEIASAVRRYKSEHNLPLGNELGRLQLALVNDGPASDIADRLRSAYPDLASITRARQIELVHELDPDLEKLVSPVTILLAIQP
jgi:valyl-tRNA synthetase